ncbi:MAG: hypothetical protein MHM6MM_005733 [Cercozoa sp. M6MM]
MKFTVATLAAASATAVVAQYDAHSSKYQNMYAPHPTTAPYAPSAHATMTLEEVTLQLKTLSKKVADLEHVDTAPSAGVGCASQCQSAMAAKVPHLCPKWCTGISSKPSVALSVLQEVPELLQDSLTADTTICLFSGIFQAIGDDAALGLEHSVLLGFRMPIVKKAGKVRASLRIGVEGVVEDDDVAKFWMANVDDDSLPKLIRDTAAGTPLAPIPKNCAADGYIVGELLNKGLVGEDKTLVKTQVEGALLDIDMSTEVQKLVNGQHWQFNNMVMILLTFMDAAGDLARDGDGPYPVAIPSEMLIKFTRPQIASNKWGHGKNRMPSYGYGQQPSYGGYDSSDYGQPPVYGNSYGSSQYGGYGMDYGTGYDNSYASYDQYDNGYGNIGVYGSSSYGSNYGSAGYAQGYDNSYASYDQYSDGYGHIAA